MQDQREKAARALWLGYFNQVLRENGIISEGDYLQMARKIRSGGRVKTGG